jgi:hypothetical protein
MTPAAGFERQLSNRAARLIVTDFVESKQR